jgi:hypothetical protein
MLMRSLFLSWQPGVGADRYQHRSEAGSESRRDGG